MTLPHQLPRVEDVEDFEIGPNRLSLVRVTPENTEALIEAALSVYLGESCKYCGRIYETLDDLRNTVFAGYHERGRLACKSCWDSNNPSA